MQTIYIMSSILGNALQFEGPEKIISEKVGDCKKTWGWLV